VTVSRRLKVAVMLIATRKLPDDDCLQNAQNGSCVDNYTRTPRR
jgi:hypothetical protein